MTAETSLPRTLLKRKGLLIANLVILLALGWNFSREFTRSQSIEDEIARLQEQKNELERKNSQLSTLSQELATSGALEREAREKLGLQLPGENVVVVKDHEPEPDKQAKAAMQEEQASREKTNAKRWWNYFFGNN